MANEQLRVEVYRGGDLQETRRPTIDEQSDYEVEINEVEPEEYECPDCSDTFDSEKGLNSHRSQVH